MRQRFVAAVLAGEKMERQWAIEYYYEDGVPSEKIMTEQERCLHMLNILIDSVKNGQKPFIAEKTSDYEVSWEQSAEDTERGIKNAGKKE